MRYKRIRKLQSDFFPMTLILIDDQEEYEEIMEAVAGYHDEPMPAFPQIGNAHTIAAETQTFGLVIFVTIGGAGELNREEFYNILTHEAVHVWQFVAKHMGERKPGIETEAYGITYYARYLWREYQHRHPVKK